MKRQVTFRPGLRLKKIRCAHCLRERAGRLYLDRFRWMIMFECGHHKELALTLPVEVLEARKLVNYSDSLDPRVGAKARAELDEYYKREMEKIYKLLMGVSHWMDGAGMIHANPCFKQTVRKISQYSSVKMNHKEMEEIYKGVMRVLANAKYRGSLQPHEEALKEIADTTGGKSQEIKRERVITGSDKREVKVGIQIQRKNIHGS